MALSMKEIGGMSDEEFAANLAKGAFGDVVEPTTETQEQEQEQNPEETQVEEKEPEQNEGENKSEGEDKSSEEDAGAKSPVTEDGNPENKDASANSETGEGNAKEGEQEAVSNSGPDYESFYKEILGKPLKVNGKDIVLSNADDVKGLIQKGVSYTRSMQELAGKRKTLLMLENAGITDDRLVLAIDLLNGNPEAIKKVLKDKAIDPLDLDMNVEPAYQPGSHQVSDAQVNFQAQLDELDAFPEGKETLRIIANDWDQASKVELGNNPAVMATIHQHRSTGIYDRTVAEVERQRLLGKIPAHMPFLQAYTQVGNEIQSRNGFADLAPKSATTAAVNTPIARTVAKPKPTVVPNKAAESASAPRGGSSSVRQAPSYKNMSDADIAKMAATMLSQ